MAGEADNEALSSDNAAERERPISNLGHATEVSQGRGLTLLVPRWNPLLSDIGDRIQVDLMAAGFTVGLKKVGREEMAFKLRQGDFDLFVALWAPDRWLDSREWLMNDFLKTQLGPVPALDAHASPNPDDLKNFEETLAEEAFVLPLFHLDLVVYSSDRLARAEANAVGIPDLSWSWLRAGGR